MVEELAMVSVLAGMGIYFVKSTDLPKDLKERSLKSSAESAQVSTVNRSKFNFPKEISEKNIQTKTVDTEALLKAKRRLELEKINLEINELTLKITTLEQEIRENNTRNVEIQKAIDTYLVRLEILNQARIS